MTENAAARPPYLRYLCAIMVASASSAALGALLGLFPLNKLPLAVLFAGVLLLLWVIIKFYQLSLAGITGVEVRSLSILSNLIAAGLLLIPANAALAALLPGLGSSLLSSVSWVLGIPLQAALFRWTTPWLPSSGPLVAYLRPLYAGFRLPGARARQAPAPAEAEAPTGSAQADAADGDDHHG